MADVGLGNLLVLLSIDAGVRARFEANMEAVMTEFNLSEAAKLAIRLEHEECIKVLANVNNQVADPGGACSEQALKELFDQRNG